MKQLTLWLLMGVLVLSGCKGSVQTIAQSRGGGVSGPNVCWVTLVSTEGGVYRHDVKNRSFWQGTTNIEVTARITVEKGTVQVWLQDSQGNKTIVGVEPGQTAELKGAAYVSGTDPRSFSIYFEPLDETKRAENVRAEIHYDTEHTIN